MTPIPTTREAWSAITPSEMDRRQVQEWMYAPIRGAGKRDDEDAHLLGDAGRGGEHELCVERLADHLRDRNDPMRSTRELCRAEARRILEDVAEPAGPA